MTNHNVTSQDLQGRKYSVKIDDLSWRPAAYAIVVKGKQLLLVKEHGAFHMPGGGVNLGETPEAAVIREVREESGLEITDVKLTGSLTTFFTWQPLNNPNESHHRQSLLLYYTCRLVGGRLSTAGHDEYEKAMGLEVTWVPIQKLGSIKVGSTVDWRPIVWEALGIDT